MIAFQNWIQQNGGFFHQDIEYARDSSGHGIIAKCLITPDSTVVSIPLDIAITRKIAIDGLVGISGVNAALLEDWSARQAIASYLSMHAIHPENPFLRHQAYIATLPTELFTGMQFTETERTLFHGTNLFNAILNRETTLDAEWTHCAQVFRELTWSSYLLSTSWISSRAFPSSLISPVDPTSADPVLLPAIDAFNHRRAEPVSWIVSSSSISLKIHSPIPASAEIFNNYGPKPNSQLILAYGFSLPQNPEDSIVLTIPGNTTKWQVGRDAAGIAGLWEVILEHVMSQEPSTYDDHLEAAALLEDMTTTLIQKLPTRDHQGQVRSEILIMWDHYLEGQTSILDGILKYAMSKRDFAVQWAADEGVEIMFDEEEDVP
ncbi:SET domain-containing protein [Mycena floridula]|nr:SET domain-containing protein [Mycena floridula]